MYDKEMFEDPCSIGEKTVEIVREILITMGWAAIAFSIVIIFS